MAAPPPARPNSKVPPTEISEAKIISAPTGSPITQPPASGTNSKPPPARSNSRTLVTILAILILIIGLALPIVIGIFSAFPETLPSWALDLPRTDDIQTEIRVSLQDAYLGRSITIQVPRVALCSHCRGTGADSPADVSSCPKCEGRGYVELHHEVFPGYIMAQKHRCSQCGGAGKSVKSTCHKCNGQKVLRETKSIVIDLKPGVPDGHRLTIPGMSHEAPDHAPGDLHVWVRVSSEGNGFQRVDRHLQTTIHVSLLEALLGFKREITTLDGRTIVVDRTTAVTSHDQVITIPNEGMPTENAKVRGNLLVKFAVRFPERDFTDAEKEELIRLLPQDAS